jgi:endonuclease YncB( thermonuclease family)
MTRLRLSQRHRNVVGWGAAGAVLAGTLLGALALFGREPAEHTARPERAPAVSSSSANTRQTVAAPPPEVKVQERPPSPVELAPRTPLELDPPFVILDGLTFSAGLNTYRLDGLAGPPPTAACRNDEGHLWACGLQARAALNNLIQRRRIVCTPLRTGPDGVAESTCKAEGEDIGGQLAAQGWARPSGDASGPYGTAAQKAEQAKRGLWNGGWTFSRPG